MLPGRLLQQLKDLAPLEERLWLVRMVIDHLGQHRIGRMQPGEPRTNLLRALS